MGGTVGDNKVAGQGNFETAAHGKTVHRTNDRFLAIEARRQAAEAIARHPHAPAGGTRLEVIAGAEGAGAGAGDNRDPQAIVSLESIENLVQFVVAFGGQ
ncbi:hypothetical protein D9M71_734810 [compost metagenome]